MTDKINKIIVDIADELNKQIWDEYDSGRAWNYIKQVNEIIGYNPYFSDKKIINENNEKLDAVNVDIETKPKMSKEEAKVAIQKHNAAMKEEHEKNKDVYVEIDPDKRFKAFLDKKNEESDIKFFILKL